MSCCSFLVSVVMLFSVLMGLGDQDYQTTQRTLQLTVLPDTDPAFKAFQLPEALRALLEGHGCKEKQDTLRKQVSAHMTYDTMLK